MTGRLLALGPARSRSRRAWSRCCLTSTASLCLWVAAVRRSISSSRSSRNCSRIRSSSCPAAASAVARAFASDCRRSASSSADRRHSSDWANDASSAASRAFQFGPAPAGAGQLGFEFGRQVGLVGRRRRLGRDVLAGVGQARLLGADVGVESAEFPFEAATPRPAIRPPERGRLRQPGPQPFQLRPFVLKSAGEFAVFLHAQPDAQLAHRAVYSW